MKFKSFLLVALAASFTLGACRKNDDDDNGPGNGNEQELSGEITSNMTLSADKEWFLDGTVVVKNNAVLTVQPGTVVKAKIGRKSSLVIAQGSKLIADGTADKPIVFTSGQPTGERRRGDWGGIILIGRATTNRTAPVTIEGGVNLTYGTEKIDDDNSGILRYVRIEYAGIGTNDSEINSLTCYAVGNKTVLDHIQTSYANDDAFEFFGGTVNASHLVAYATSDDDFDFDFGYSGTVQYAVALRHPEFADTADDSNGIECDNDKDGTDASPVTHPKLSNFTIIGPNNVTGTDSRHAYGNRWRRGTKFTFNNSIILGSQKGGLLLEGDKVATFYKNGDSQFKNNIVASYTAPFLANQVATNILTTAELQTKALGEGNVSIAASAVNLTAPFNLSAPNFLPATGSPALAGTFAAVPGAKAESFRGAFGTTNWLAGWTDFSLESN